MRKNDCNFSYRHRVAPPSSGQGASDDADSPYNVLGSTYLPVDESTVSQWARDGIKAARMQVGYGRKVNIVRFSTEDSPGSPAMWSRIVGAGASLVKKRILFVSSGDGIQHQQPELYDKLKARILSYRRLAILGIPIDKKRRIIKNSAQ